MEQLNVAIADDNDRILEVLADIIHSDKDLKLVGQATEKKCIKLFRTKNRMLSYWI